MYMQPYPYQLFLNSLGCSHFWLGQVAIFVFLEPYCSPVPQDHSVRDYSGWDQGVPVRCEFGLQATWTALGANLDARLPNLRISPRDGVYLGHCSLVHCDVDPKSGPFSGSFLHSIQTLNDFFEN